MPEITLETETFKDRRHGNGASAWSLGKVKERLNISYNTIVLEEKGVGDLCVGMKRKGKG